MVGQHQVGLQTRCSRWLAEPVVQALDQVSDARECRFHVLLRFAPAENLLGSLLSPVLRRFRQICEPLQVGIMDSVVGEVLEPDQIACRSGQSFPVPQPHHEELGGVFRQKHRRLVGLNAVVANAEGLR